MSDEQLEAARGDYGPMKTIHLRWKEPGSDTLCGIPTALQNKSQVLWYAYFRAANEGIGLAEKWCEECLQHPEVALHLLRAKKVPSAISDSMRALQKLTDGVAEAMFLSKMTDPLEWHGLDELLEEDDVPPDSE